MDDVESFERIVAARMLLKDSLEKSTSIASALEKTGSRLEEIKQRLPSLEAAVRRKCSIVAVGDHINRAVGPAAAVLKVFDGIHGLEKLVLSGPNSDLHGYILVVKRLEEALRFLAENCRLAIGWLEDAAEFLRDNAVDEDNRYITNVSKSLKILQMMQTNEERARLDGGLLSAAYKKLEMEFRRLLGVISSPSPLPEVEIQKLKAIVERLNASNNLRNCLCIYVDVRCSYVRACLQRLDLDYLQISILEFDNLQNWGTLLGQWSNHLEYAVKNLLELEHELCNNVFEEMGLNVSMDCFAKMVSQSGFLALLQFGNTVADSKREAVKLFKLLKIFGTLNELRLDFNRLFGGKYCIEIQTQTRDLIKKVILGGAEIFLELLTQVEVYRPTSPPSDGSIPRLLSFVVDYCQQLVGKYYRPTLIQVLKIHQNWKHEKFEEELLEEEVCKIVEAILLNLDSWSKAYEDTALSYIFLMNNHWHLYKALKGTKLGDLMGASQVREQERRKDYYAALYLRESWGMVLGILGHDQLNSFSKVLIKKKLKAFNEALDGTYKKQLNWVVPDQSLRKSTCELVIDAVVPAYTSYIKAYGHFIDQESKKYVKYTAESLGRMLRSMFQPKMEKCCSTKTKPSIDRVGDIVSTQFPSTPIAT